MLQRSGEIPFEKVHVTAGSCQLDLGHESLRLAVGDVAGELVVDPLAPSLKLTYRFPGEGAGTRCELAGTRDRRTEQIETSVALTTVEGPPLPARVLNVFFDAADWLGSTAKFEGTLHLHQAGSRDWEADYRGELHDVDLAKLVGRRFPRHRLTGRARVAIKEAKWGQRPTQGWGWLEAKGELAAGQGSIGIDLVDALAREMKFRRSPRLVNLDAQDRCRLSCPGSVICNGVQWRDPNHRSVGRGIPPRCRHCRSNHVALVGPPGNSQRSRSHQDALSDLAGQFRGYGSTHRRVATLAFSPRPAGVRHSDTTDGRWELSKRSCSGMRRSDRIEL